MPKTIRWGIIGCGNVTEVKSGPALQKAHNSALVMVMRRNGELAADYARRHHVPRWTDDAEELIHAPEVDAVYIATPPDSHAAYAVMVAAAGKPVYVEKPMARTSAEGEAMIEACAAAGVPLWVAYYRRALPRFRQIKALLDAGAIGDVRSVLVDFHRQMRPAHDDPANLPWRVIPEIAGGGIFLDLAAHTLDYLDYFLGPIVELSGHAANLAGRYPAEDIVAGNFVFAGAHGPVYGTGLWNFDAYTDLDRTEIVGNKGRLIFTTFDDAPVQLVTSSGTTSLTVAHPPHIQQPLIQTIVDELNGDGQCPSTGISGIRTTKVMETMIANYYL